MPSLPLQDSSSSNRIIVMLYWQGSILLKRISNEFLFRALYVPIGEKNASNDGDIIQFASGLDVHGSDIDGKLVLSYGINDCEGAVMMTTISMEKLHKMLVELEPGQEVAYLMRKIKSEV